MAFLLQPDSNDVCCDCDQLVGPCEPCGGAINSITVETRVTAFNNFPAEESCAMACDFTWSYTWTREAYDHGAPPTGDHFQIYNDGTKDILIHPTDVGDFAAAISASAINATTTCGRDDTDAPDSSNAFNFDVFFNSDTGNIEAGANGAVDCSEPIGSVYDPCGFGDDGISFTPFAYDLAGAHTYNLDNTTIYNAGIKELRIRMTITMAP